MPETEADELVLWATTHWTPTLAVAMPGVGPNISRQDLEDCVQEALIELWMRATGRRTSAPVDNWRTWFVRIGRNRAVKRMSANMAKATTAAEPGRADGETPSFATGRCDLMLVAEALATLSPDDQTLLRMTASGAEPCEIRRVLGLPSDDAFRQRLSRARGRLRASLGETDGAGGESGGGRSRG